MKANHSINEDTLIFSFVIFFIFGVAVLYSPLSIILNPPVGLVLLEAWNECFKRRGNVNNVEVNTKLLSCNSKGEVMYRVCISLCIIL